MTTTIPSTAVLNKQGIQETLELLDAIEQVYLVAKNDVLPKLNKNQKVNIFALVGALLPLQSVLNTAIAGADKITNELADLNEAEFKKIFGERITKLAWLATQDLRSK